MGMAIARLPYPGLSQIPLHVAIICVSGVKFLRFDECVPPEPAPESMSSPEALVCSDIVDNGQRSAVINAIEPISYCGPVVPVAPFA